MVFLEAVADRFAHRASLERTCFVFPNRRSGTFFKRYLGKAAGRPLFVPSVLTIDELFTRIAGLQETRQKARLLYVLYQEYIKLMPGSPDKGPEPFDQFIYWGDILLADFDDLDKYLVDVRRLLINLRDLKALSTDYDFLSDDQKQAIAAFCNSFEAPGLSGSRRQFAELWDILNPLYQAFRQSLQEKGLAYAGMIYRAVAENLDDAQTVLPQYDEIVFIGLNALNACEKRLLDHLRRDGRADFYWDFAGPMVTDPDNPAGRFLRENVKRYPPKQPFDCPAPDPHTQRFEVIRVPSAVGQTRKAMQILQDLQRDGALAHPEETAVVLPDENLLYPMLGAVPDGIEKVNVTMGYSLSASSGATLFPLLERLQANRRIHHAAPAFYHRDVVYMLEHPYFAAAADPDTIATVKAGIRQENRIFVPEADLAQKGEPFATVFRTVDSTAGLPDYLCAVIAAVQAPQEPLEREFLYRYHETVTDLADSGLPLETLEPRTWFRLLAQYIALVKIPFEGEPLSGLQIMGPLETRALDFRNILILSVGEGIFPSRSVSASFIPYNLRLGFGLPTYELQDAMWAYYFYRSICRAGRIYLLYDARTEGLQSGEESRFIKQLRYLYEVPMTEKVVTYAISSEGMTREPLCVKKDEAVMQELRSRFFEQRKSLSATALNAYQECPLRFYYQYVKGLREQDDVVEEVDSGLFGTIYHAVMEQLYRPYVGELLKPDMLRALRRDRKRIEALAEAAFHENHITDIAGENRILLDLIVHFVQRTLEVDANIGSDGNPLYLCGVEQAKTWALPLSDGRTVELFGKIDRLDSRESGVIRVVDYKSGAADRPGVKFQLKFYALILSRRERQGRRYTPCVYALRGIFSDTPPRSLSLSPGELDAFEQEVRTLVEEILSPGAFQASDDSDVCKYCNFKRLCNRR